MKHGTLLLMTFLFLALSASVAAQDAVVRTKMFGINPLGLPFGIYSGHLGFIVNDGANEINIPFFYWDINDGELTIISVGAKYRFYKTGGGKGPFYGPTFQVVSVNWEYSDDYEDDETITAVLFTPGGEIGYRWSWDNGFTFAPCIGAGFTIGDVKSSDGEEADYSSGLAWSLGLGFAYMF
ncbi:MAG: hypothetical protein K8R90_11125 [Candidatus Cloacimonetes bacterium]|nr:hypothetical protein [Candidatus Cloacimonadota bacterium]